MSIQSINERNQFCGTIRDVVFGDVLSEVEVETSSGIVSSVVTTTSLNELGLSVGSKVLTIFKPTDVALAIS